MLGDSFVVKSKDKEIELVVIATDPGKYGIVGPKTMLYSEGEPIER